MKKNLLTGFLCAVILCAIVPTAQAETRVAEPRSTAVSLPDPFIPYSTLPDLKAAAPFAVKSPQLLPTNCRERYMAMLNNKNLIQIFYSNDDQTIVYRMAVLEEGRDISGDYTNYDKEDTLAVGDKEILVKGKDDTIHVALWNDDHFSYSLSFSKGISQKLLVDILENIE